MRLRARIEFVYPDSRTAELVSRLLEIDNRAASKNMKVRTESRGSKVTTCLEHEKLNTFSATIYDLLFCEKLICDVLGY